MKIKLACALWLILLSACTTTLKPSPDDTWKLFNKSIKSNNIHYRVKVEYPLFSASNPTLSQPVNSRVAHFINQAITEFKSQIPPNSTDLRDLPATMQQNYLNISYDSYMTENQFHHTLLSLRFHIEKKLAGSTQAIQDYWFLNDDLSANKPLVLASLFKPDSHYLKDISNYCLTELTHKYTPDMPWITLHATGITPKLKNYRHWNLTRKGILITFKKEQLEPYTDSADSVLVPYESVRDLLVE
jgi:hypothetical protein